MATARGQICVWTGEKESSPGTDLKMKLCLQIRPRTVKEGRLGLAYRVTWVRWKFTDSHKTRGTMPDGI